eukprot:1802721-Rhodomonas_salina.1
MHTRKHTHNLKTSHKTPAEHPRVSITPTLLRKQPCREQRSARPRAPSLAAAPSPTPPRPPPTLSAAAQQSSAPRPAARASSARTPPPMSAPQTPRQNTPQEHHRADPRRTWQSRLLRSNCRSASLVLSSAASSFSRVVFASVCAFSTPSNAPFSSALTFASSSSLALSVAAPTFAAAA